MGNKIKSTSVPKTGVKIKPLIEKIEIEDFKHPIFCFKYLQKDFNLENCNQDEKTALIEQIVRLSSMDWQDIQYTQRHGLGSEKISVSSIKASKPSIITEEVESLLALRFLGKAPFVGLRNRFIFHVIYIDRAYTLYPH